MRSTSISSIRASRSTPRGRSAWRRWRWALPPFVRVPANTPEYISRVLDCGALGIVAPDVRSAEEARAVVAAAKYRAARRPRRRRAAAAPALPQLSGRGGERGAQCGDHGDRAVRELGGGREAPRRSSPSRASTSVLIGTNDLLASLGLRRPVRARQGARGLRAHHRRRQQARQARGRRRPRLAPAAGRRVRQAGRPLRLDRHRPRLPAGRSHQARQGGAGPASGEGCPLPSSRAGAELRRGAGGTGPSNTHTPSIDL